MAQVNFDCSAHIAKPHELAEVMQFYKDNLPPTVHMRDEAVFRAAIDNQLFFIVRNNQGEIIAGAANYVLNDGKFTPHDVNLYNNKTSNGVIYELGSVLRKKGGLPAGKEAPGRFLALLFSVPQIMLLDRLMKDLNLPRADFLSCDVQTQVTVDGQPKRVGAPVILRINGSAQPSPLRFKQIEAAEGLIGSKKETLLAHDESANNPRDYFTAPIQGLPEVAKYLRLVINKGLPSYYNEFAGINMRELYEAWTTGIVPANADSPEKRITLLDFLVTNAKVIEKLPATTRWNEFANMVDHSLDLNKKRPAPLNTNGGYHNIRQDEPFVLQSGFKLSAADMGTRQQEQVQQQQQMQQQHRQSATQDVGDSFPSIAVRPSGSPSPIVAMGSGSDPSTQLRAS